MVRKILAQFEVPYLQILNEKGICDEDLMPEITQEQMVSMYRWMVITRVFDDKALKLQRQGRIGTYAQTLGQEACQIGTAFALEKGDWAFPAFRENGVFMYRGVPAHMLYQYWAGDERGMHIPKDIAMFPVSITVGGHLPHAVGAAMAFNYLKQKNASIVYFGDGATSEGDFHESLNFAGVYKSPCVFICQNNQWAISLPVSEQTASQTIAQKAIAYGIECVQVDGNDVFGVYAATLAALARARAGKGATLIECFTYRLTDHTTSDDAKRYRDPAEIEGWKKKDPMIRLEQYLIKKKMINPIMIAKMWSDAEQMIEKEVAISESMTSQPPTEMFDYLYEKAPVELLAQREQSLRENKTVEVKKPTGNEASHTSTAGVVGEIEEAKEDTAEKIEPVDKAEKNKFTLKKKIVSKETSKVSPAEETEDDEDIL